MKNLCLRIGVLAVLVLVLNACVIPPTEITYVDVVAVSWHRGSHYTLWIQDRNSAKVEPITIFADKAEVFTDVPEGKKFWARAVKQLSGLNSGKIYYAEIHINSLKSLHGGNWRSGKFSTGTTHFIAAW